MFYVRDPDCFGKLLGPFWCFFGKYEGDDEDNDEEGRVPAMAKNQELLHIHQQFHSWREVFFLQKYFHDADDCSDECDV